MTMHRAVMRRESGTPPSSHQGLNGVDHGVDCAAYIWRGLVREGLNHADHMVPAELPTSSSHASPTPYCLSLRLRPRDAARPNYELIITYRASDAMASLAVASMTMVFEPQPNDPAGVS